MKKKKQFKVLSPQVGDLNIVKEDLYLNRDDETIAEEYAGISWKIGSYSTRNTSHHHIASITAEQLKSLIENKVKSVIIKSTVLNGHDHDLTVKMVKSRVVVTDISKNSEDNHIAIPITNVSFGLQELIEDGPSYGAYYSYQSEDGIQTTLRMDDYEPLKASVSGPSFYTNFRIGQKKFEANSSIFDGTVTREGSIAIRNGKVHLQQTTGDNYSYLNFEDPTSQGAEFLIPAKEKGNHFLATVNDVSDLDKPSSSILLSESFQGLVGYDETLESIGAILVISPGKYGSISDKENAVLKQARAPFRIAFATRNLDVPYKYKTVISKGYDLIFKNEFYENKYGKIDTENSQYFSNSFEEAFLVTQEESQKPTQDKFNKAIHTYMKAELGNRYEKGIVDKKLSDLDALINQKIGQVVGQDQLNGFREEINYYLGSKIETSALKTQLNDSDEEIPSSGAVLQYLSDMAAPDLSAYYDKSYIDANYVERAEIEGNFYNKGQFYNEMNNYMNRNEILSSYYSKSESHDEFLHKSNVTETVTNSNLQAPSGKAVIDYVAENLNGGSGVVDAGTYLQLQSLMNESQLVPGSLYKFAHKHQNYSLNPAGSAYNGSQDEIFIATALDDSTLSTRVVSLEFKDDEIDYDFREGSNGSGRVIRRKDTERNIEMFFDWRKAMFYDKSKSSMVNVFTAPYTRCSNVYIGRDNNYGENSIKQIIFSNNTDVINVRITNITDDILMGNCQNVDIKILTPADGRYSLKDMTVGNLTIQDSSNISFSNLVANSVTIQNLANVTEVKDMMQLNILIETAS